MNVHEYMNTGETVNMKPGIFRDYLTALLYIAIFLACEAVVIVILIGIISLIER